MSSVQLWSSDDNQNQCPNTPLRSNSNRPGFKLETCEIKRLEEDIKWPVIGISLTRHIGEKAPERNSTRATSPICQCFAATWRCSSFRTLGQHLLLRLKAYVTLYHLICCYILPRRLLGHGALRMIQPAWLLISFPTTSKKQNILSSIFGRRSRNSSK